MNPFARFEPPSIQSAFIAGCNLVSAYTINCPSPTCAGEEPPPIKTFPSDVMRAYSPPLTSNRSIPDAPDSPIILAD